MIGLLFDKTFWYGVVAILAIVAIIIAIFKYPQARPYVFTFSALILAGLTMYCGIQIDKYYTAQGGIHGKLEQLMGINRVEQQEEELNFKLENLVLVEDINGNYTATITSSTKLKVEDINYSIFVNDEPLSNVTCQHSATGVAVRGEYHYIFKNIDLVPICDDTLTINFVAFANGYQITLTTHESQKANYWSKYFSKNSFVLTIEPFKYSQSDKIDFIEGDISNFFKYEYIVDNETYMTMFYEHGKKNELLPAPEKANCEFISWCDNKGNAIPNVANETNLKLYAKYISFAEEQDGTWLDDNLEIEVKDCKLISATFSSKVLSVESSYNSVSKDYLVKFGNGPAGDMYIKIKFNEISKAWEYQTNFDTGEFGEVKTLIRIDKDNVCTISYYTYISGSYQLEDTKYVNKGGLLKDAVSISFLAVGPVEPPVNPNQYILLGYTSVAPTDMTARLISGNVLDENITIINSDISLYAIYQVND